MGRPSVGPLLRSYASSGSRSRLVLMKESHTISRELNDKLHTEGTYFWNCQYQSPNGDYFPGLGGFFFSRNSSA